MTMSDLTLDVGLAAKLKVAFARNGWTEALIDKACEGDSLGQFRKVLQGHATITVVEHVIDCDADPFLPNGWKVEEHQKGGQFKWDPSNHLSNLPILYLDEKGQRNGKSIEGNKLREKLAKDLVKGALLNANVLDYLLANPHLIPEEWKKDEKGNTRYIFFWGTVYRLSDGYLCVRYLCWDVSRWYWGSHWLDDDWGDGDPAAVRAS